jgi:hypothetical protein
MGAAWRLMFYSCVVASPTHPPARLAPTTGNLIQPPKPFQSPNRPTAQPNKQGVNQLVDKEATAEEHAPIAFIIGGCGKSVSIVWGRVERVGQV